MPSLSLITTTAGRAAILGAVAGSSTLVVDDAQLSDVDQSVGIGTTSLTNVVATLAAVGSVRVAGAGHALHVVLADDTTAAYDVRTIALRLDDGTFLMVYSQAGIIATKAAGSSLHLAFDLTIDADTAATLDFGDTDYALPSASESSAGVVEIATTAEVLAGVDTTRAVTPYNMGRAIALQTRRLAISSRVLRAAAGGYSDAFNACASKIDCVVAVGQTGHIQSSYDAGVWTARTAAGGFVGSFYGICYGGGLFVAVGSSGTIQTSPDGTMWTARMAAGGFSGNFTAVTYGGGLFVAVGASGTIQTSPDGTTWTARTAAGGFSGSFNAVTYGGGLFVAVGASGTIQTSPNGTTWTARTAAGGFSSSFLSVAYGGGLFVAVGSSGTIQTSPDGTTWTARTADTYFADLTGAGASNYYGLAYSDGLWVLVGELGEIQSSGDALEWVSSFNSAYLGSLASICFTTRGLLMAGAGGYLWQVRY